MLKMFRKKLIVSTVLAGALLLSNIGYSAEYSPGADDKEIKVGNTAPYSGPAAALNYIVKTMGAYFKKVNDEGGVNGRKIVFISHDDAYNPAKTLEQTRRLVENDKVLFVMSQIGTPTSLAARKYLNEKKIPQLFIASSAQGFDNPKEYPWSIAFNLLSLNEGRVLATYIKQNIPNAKIAILYQNDDFGKTYVKGFKEGLGDKASTMIVKELSHEATDPSVDSQIITFKDSGANVFFGVSTPKIAGQALMKIHALKWKPTIILPSGSSPTTVLKKLPKEATNGVISAGFFKSPFDKRYANDPAVKDYIAFMKKYVPELDISDTTTIYSYTVAQTVVEVLKQAGDTLTHANIMDKATHLDQTMPMLMPGVKLQTTPSDYSMIKKVKMVKYNNGQWQSFGDLLDAK